MYASPSSVSAKLLKFSSIKSSMSYSITAVYLFLSESHPPRDRVVGVVAEDEMYWVCMVP